MNKYTDEDGDEWVPLPHLVSDDERSINTAREEMSVAYFSRQFRIVKYTPAE
jgi:hypothetical protein